MYTIVAIALVAGLVIGFVAGRSSIVKEVNNQSEEKDIQERNISFDHTNDTFAPVEGEGIMVADQDAGDVIVVSSVTLSQDGWVAIREVIDGNMGNILGAARFEGGEYVNVEIPLLRATISGGEYKAVIYRDNGDKTFDHNFDSLVVDGDNPVSDSFLAY